MLSGIFYFFFFFCYKASDFHALESSGISYDSVLFPKMMRRHVSI